MKKFLICGLLVLFAIPVFAICDHTLHVADTEIQLCTTKNTTPSLNVKLGDTVYYANITTEDAPINSLTPKKLKVMYENTVHTVHDNVEYKFFFTPETDSNIYSFRIMAAAGTFYINWGDGVIEKIVKNNFTREEYSHTYNDSASNHEIALGGKATKYASYNYDAVISFWLSKSHLKSMRGSLGQIFPTIEKQDGTLDQPMFVNAFRENNNLTTIPSELFDGIYGQLEANMFHKAFDGCSSIGSIPENLFGNLSGDLQNNVFTNAFAGCKNLTGSSTKINGKYLYEIWPDATSVQVGGCYRNATNLTDYADIPSLWK